MSEPIKRENIRKGDRVRMIATTEFTAGCDFTESDLEDADDERYELIKRAMVPPTEPGIYAHAQNGLHYFLNDDGDIWCLENMDGHGGGGPYSPLGYDIADLNLLRPVAEVAAEVLAEVQKAISLRTVPEQGSGRCLVSPLNLMSDVVLIRAKWATK